MGPEEAILSVNRILDSLNPAQQTAVTSPAPVIQVLAPPGSGKTKTLTARTAYLLAHHGYKPWNVICCTFTIKASREMRERIAKLIGHELESKLILGTFHSICRRYLVSYGHLIGLPKGFGIADESDAKGILKRIIKRLDLNIEPKVARSRISRQKAQGLHSSDPAAKPTKSIDQQEFVKVFQEYETALGNSNLLDYDDLLLKCSELLRLHPSCVSNVEAVLVDEFQDTNIVQFDLMRLFAGQKKRITIVGDPDQSIYGFRSAEIKNLTRMRNQYPDTIVVNLEENYRSSGAILRSADQVIRQDISRPAKDLLPTYCYGSLPTLRKLPSAAAEAAWTVMEIQRAIAMTGNMLNYSDFAILLRSSSLSRNIESALGKEGVPYRMVGGHRFFDRYEIKVLLDYLRTISQPQNSDALVRIINIPARKIGDVTIKALLEEAETQKMSLWSLILDAVQGRKQPKTKLNNGHDQGLGFVINLILNARKKLGECNDAESPLELLNYVIQKISWQKHLEDKDPENHEDRWANVEELLAQAGDASVAAQSEDPGSDQLPQLENVEMQVQAGGEEALSRFLANVALSTELRQDDNEALKATVTISTIHAAKGLEWPVVFIPAAYDGSIPHSRAEDQDEERRLLYVAMTRAQSLLYVSCPRQSSQQEITLSCFLPPKVVKGRFVEKGPKFTAQVVESIAMILGRRPPSEAEIFAASLNIKHVEDNLWSANGEIDKGDEWDETRREAESHTDWPQLAKRRRIEESSTNTSIETPHEYPSFMSASRVNIMAQATTMSQFKPSQPKTEISSGASLVGKKQTIKKCVKVQGTLGSFFKNNQVPTADYTEREIPEIPIPLPPMKKSIPEEFSHHRLKVESTTQRPPLLLNCPPSKTYHFLSSSPPALKAPKGDHERERPPAVVEQSRGRNNMEAAPTVVRSAMTFHTTSIQQVQGIHSTTRRTLGIRRTFNGWADRMSREEKRI